MPVFKAGFVSTALRCMNIITKTYNIFGISSLYCIAISRKRSIFLTAYVYNFVMNNVFVFVYIFDKGFYAALVMEGFLCFGFARLSPQNYAHTAV